MPKIYITRPITVNLDSGESVSLKPGLQQVSQEAAEHWFVKANSQALEDIATDDVSGQIINDLNQKLANTQAELEVANKLATDNAALVETARVHLVKSQTDLAAKTKALADTNSKLDKSSADNKAKDDRIAALEKELAAVKAKSAPAAGQST